MRTLLGVDLRIHGHEWLIDQATRFTAALGGSLDFLFVAGARAPDDEVERHRARLKSMLERVPAEHRGEPHVKRGSPAEVLIETTADYDAMVVGPRDPGALENLLLGPMATRVIHRAQCPVLIPRTEFRGVKRALLGVHPYNGFGEALVALASTWVARLGGRLDGAYVEPGSIPYIPDARVRAQAERELLQSREPDREAVVQLLRPLPEGVRGEGRIAIGDPGEKLVDLSTEYDLVVVGTMERTGLARYVMGSVATYVVRNAKCPVMTLPAPHVAG